MGFYNLLVTAYHQLIAPFPPTLQWFLTLALVVGVAVLFFHLIRSSWIFLLVLVVLLPVLLPLVWGLFVDVWHFLLYLLLQVGIHV